LTVPGVAALTALQKHKYLKITLSYRSSRPIDVVRRTAMQLTTKKTNKLIDDIGYRSVLKQYCASLETLIDVSCVRRRCGDDRLQEMDMTYVMDLPYSIDACADLVQHYSCST
jgi:hypothetical protein